MPWQTWQWSTVLDRENKAESQDNESKDEKDIEVLHFERHGSNDLWREMAKAREKLGQRIFGVETGNGL